MRAGAKCECEGLGNFSYLPMWVHSWGCWFRVGGGACIRGSVLGSTANKVVGRGSGFGSLWGFFVGTIFSMLRPVFWLCFIVLVLGGRM